MFEHCHQFFKHFILFSALVGILCIVLFPVHKFISFHVSDRIEIDKCPFCLGGTMCSRIKDEFELSSVHFWTNLLNICLNKPIIFGTLGTEMVVLKWASYSNNYKDYVDSKESDSNMDKIMQSIRPLPRFSQLYDASLEDFVLCPRSPTTQKFGSFLKPIFDKGKTPKPDDDIMELYKNVLHTLQVSTEPIVQQVTQEWAVARYLGACGDISVSEYCGRSLTSVFSELTWTQRSSLASQLLHFALNATFDNPEFAFYFTDLSPDNFAVSDEFEIRLVDLDNVIVVDKDPTDKPANWETEHKTYHDESIYGFAFSSEEICSHKISDTNVYSICQGILSDHSDLLPGGLLHCAPPPYSALEKLVENCVSPPTESSRFDIAQSILEVLQ